MIHGTTTGYTFYACRCLDCLAASRAASRARQQRLRAERVEVDGRLVHPRAPHGTHNGYTSWSCRCPPCTEAARIGGQRYRARGTA